MEAKDEPYPGPSLDAPTEHELAELAALLVDPAPARIEGWYRTMDIIELAMAEDPTLSQEAARGRLKRLAADGKIEKLTHGRKCYWRMKDGGTDPD